MLKYVVVIENNKTNFCAFSPDVPGCSATGNSIAQAVKEMTIALEAHVNNLEEIPQSKGLDHYMNDDSFKKKSSDYVLQVEVYEDY